MKHPRKGGMLGIVMAMMMTNASEKETDYVWTMNHTIRHEEEDEDDEINNTLINLIYYVIVFVLGLPGNAIIVFTYMRKKRKTSTDVLIIIQSVVDFVACVFTPAFIIRNGFSHLTTTGLCRFTYFSEQSAAFTSLFLTTVISIDRYLSVCRPFRRRMTVRASILIATLCAILAIVINIPMTTFSRVDSAQGGKHLLCSMSASYKVSLSFNVILMMLFVISMLTSIILYGIIYSFLRKRARIHDELVGNALPLSSVHPRVSHDDASSGSNVKTTSDCAVDKQSAGINRHSTHLNVRPYSADTAISDLQMQKLSKQHSKEGPVVFQSTQSYLSVNGGNDIDQSALKTSRHPATSSSQPYQPPPAKKKESDLGRKTTRMLLIITVYFFVTWSPNIVLRIVPIEYIRRLNRSNKSYRTLIDILRALRLTNHVVNFFVYYLVNRVFRRAVKDALPKC